MKNQLENHKALLKSDDEFLIYRTLRDKLSLDHAAVCGIMANICFESDFHSNILQYSFAEQFGLSSLEYTQKVDDGEISLDEFSRDTAGYGLCQWTYYFKKKELYKFLKDRGLSIGDLRGQTDFIIYELENSFPNLLREIQNKRKGHSVSVKNKKCTVTTEDTLQRAYDIAALFCATYEKPKMFKEELSSRGRLAEIFYVQYMDPFAGKFSHRVRKVKTVPESIETIYQKQILNENYIFIENISPSMINTAISLEDINFRKHHGIDYIKIIQALYRNVIFKKRIGGSTITEQLARNLYLTPEKTIRRKLKELRQARYIEKRLSKDQILELYLNVIYYGHGAYGILNASRSYFGCEPSELTDYQSVALCAVLPAPSKFNPFVDGNLFLRRIDLVLGILKKHKDIDENGIRELQKKEKDFAFRIRERMNNSNLSEIFKKNSIGYKDSGEGKTNLLTLPSSKAMNAESLVNYVYEVMKIPNVYCKGGLGQILTHKWLINRIKENPEFRYEEKNFDMLWNIPNGEIRIFDCSGLIKSFLMGGLGHFVYDKSKDINAVTMFNKATVKGTIDTIPEIPGICVYMTNHVGVYVGNREVIEATPNPDFGNGVVMTRLTERAWSHWFQLSGINYES